MSYPEIEEAYETIVAACRVAQALGIRIVNRETVYPGSLQRPSLGPPQCCPLSALAACGGLDLLGMWDASNTDAIFDHAEHALDWNGDSVQSFLSGYDGRPAPGYPFMSDPYAFELGERIAKEVL